MVQQWTIDTLHQDYVSDEDIFYFHDPQWLENAYRWYRRIHSREFEQRIANADLGEQVRLEKLTGDCPLHVVRLNNIGDCYV